MKPSYFFLILLLCCLPVSAVEIGEGVCFNFTNVSITTNGTHTFNSLSVHPYHVEMKLPIFGIPLPPSYVIDIFGVNTTNYIQITNWSWTNITTFNTTCINMDIWFNCTNNNWEDNLVGMYMNNTLTGSQIADSGTISYQFIGVAGDNYFKFETYTTSESKNVFSKLITIIIDFIGVIDSILTLFLSVLPLFIGILIFGFVTFICVGVFGKLKQW